MTELTPKGNLFDKSFEVQGRYVAQFKSGQKVCYKQRTEIWKDKTACYWVSLVLWDNYPTEPQVSMSLDELGILHCSDDIGTPLSQLDVRYNEISAIWEI